MARLRVKELAEAQGLNITTLARKAELSYRPAWMIWHDRVSQLDFRTLDRLAKALGVEVGDLFAPDLDAGDILDSNIPDSIRAPGHVATALSTT